MTPVKFATWLKSYTDSLEQAPTPEQWEHIKEVLNSVAPEELPTVSISQSVIPGYLLEWTNPGETGRKFTISDQ